MPQLPQEYANLEVSSATINPVDLEAAFERFLIDHFEFLTDAHRELMAMDYDESEIPDRVEILFDILCEIAPEGTEFSAADGDGASFGFWKVEEEYL